MRKPVEPVANIAYKLLFTNLHKLSILSLMDNKDKHRVVFFMDREKYRKLKAILSLKGISISDFFRGKSDQAVSKDEDTLR